MSYEYAMAFRFDDVPGLAEDVRARLTRAVHTVEVTKLPMLTPYAERPDNKTTP